MQTDLVVRLRARDPRAFRELFEAQNDDLRRVAVRVTRDANAADDVVQDAWVQIVRNIDRFQERSLLSTWLHRIVFNAALMHLRRQRKFAPPLANEKMVRAENAEDPNPATRAVDEQVDDRRLLMRVEKAVRGMSASHRETLHLAYEELSMREMAERLGSSEPAIKTRLHRARRALRQEVA